MKKINNYDNIRMNFIWNIVGTLTYSLTSLIFMIIVTRINGIEEAGAFTFAFTIACLIQVIGNYAGRTFQVTEPQTSNIKEFDFINHKIITSFIMIIALVFFIVIKGYASFKTILIILLSILKMVEMFCESFYAIMQQRGELYKSGISMFLKGIGSIIIFGFIDFVTHNLFLCILFCIIWLMIIMFLFDIRIIKKYQISKVKFDIKNIIYIFKNGFYVFIITFLTQYVVNAPKYAIDAQLTDEFQTIFGIIIMPATFVILSGQFLVQPFVVNLSSSFERKEYSHFMKLIFKIVSAIACTGILIVICAYFFGIPVLEIIYGIQLDSEKLNLLIILTGATLYAISFMFSTALIIMRKTFTQLILFITVSIFTLIISEIFVSNYQIFGASAAYLCTMLLLAVLYFFDFIFYILKSKKGGNTDE